MVSKQQIFAIGDGRVKVKGICVGLPRESAKTVLLEQGFTRVEEHDECSVFKGNIEPLGLCKLAIWGNNSIGRIVITTEKKYNEDDMMTIFEQVKEELPSWPRYDYDDFGVTPRPHEIDYFWDLDEGLVKLQWDGYNVKSFSHNKDGLDIISIDIMGPIVKDEEYWRSEVD